MMTYDEARDHMRAGANVRRDVWVTTVRMDGDALLWNLTPEEMSSIMGVDKPDPYYRPTALDKNALDWEVVP